MPEPQTVVDITHTACDLIEFLASSADVPVDSRTDHLALVTGVDLGITCATGIGGKPWCRTTALADVEIGVGIANEGVPTVAHQHAIATDSARIAGHFNRVFEAQYRGPTALVELDRRFICFRLGVDVGVPLDNLWIGFFDLWILEYIGDLGLVDFGVDHDIRFVFDNVRIGIAHLVLYQIEIGVCGEVVRECVARKVAVDRFGACNQHDQSKESKPEQTSVV